MLPIISRAGAWFLRSGIQQADGGVARYYRTDAVCNHAVSTEITGYAASTCIYLHALTREDQYLDHASAAARFLVSAWDHQARAMPFETEPPARTYFFDCGIIARGLLALWRAAGQREFLDTAALVGRSMAEDFAAPGGEFHPILSVPEKCALARDPARWSRMPGCYQLKAAMAWWDLAEATGEESFRELYLRVLDYSLHSYGCFLPGHADRTKVMDRLHAFLYFLEGLLPRVDDRRCASALCDGIRRAAQLLREIAPEFERSDVYAQLLRIRYYADEAGAAPLDREAAREEAEKLMEFQAAGEDARTDGGFYFGRRAGEWLPYVNPVSTAFALQALAIREGEAVPHRAFLI